MYFFLARSTMKILGFLRNPLKSIGNQVFQKSEIFHWELYYMRLRRQIAKVVPSQFFFIWGFYYYENDFKNSIRLIIALLNLLISIFCCVLLDFSLRYHEIQWNSLEKVDFFWVAVKDQWLSQISRFLIIGGHFGAATALVG